MLPMPQNSICAAYKFLPSGSVSDRSLRTWRGISRASSFLAAKECTRAAKLRGNFRVRHEGKVDVTTTQLSLSFTASPSVRRLF